ncbi:hypothetical protein, partial [Pseudoscardovia suis]|uniref:hypothetical protein n=1 Tax=Pseudoscardovia suis TaxID=987063 RepID=UPI003F9E9949
RHPGTRHLNRMDRPAHARLQHLNEKSKAITLVPICRKGKEKRRKEKGWGKKKEGKRKPRKGGAGWWLRAASIR